MKYHRPIVVLGVVAVLVFGTVGPTVAHEEQTVEGNDVTFGGADEPLITGERMWLEFEIVDNETGEPVANQSETLIVSIQKLGREKVPLDVSEKYGEPGVYEAAVIFTEPGDYIVHLEGTLNGTEIHTHFEKEVHDHTALEYPGDGNQTTGTKTETPIHGDDQPTDSETETHARSATPGTQNDESGDQVNRADFYSGFDFGVAAAVTGVAAVVGLGFLRRRR